MHNPNPNSDFDTDTIYYDKHKNYDETSKIIIKRYIEKFDCLRGLPELQYAISSCLPESLLTKITDRLRSYDEDSIILNIDGFINFRLNTIKDELDAYISNAVSMCVSRQKYFEFLDAMRCYVNETPEIIDELYITSNTADKEDADVALDLMLEFLPRKIFVCMPQPYDNTNFIDSLQYIFGSRVILLS